MKLDIKDISETDEVAEKFLAAIGNRRHIAFHGEMGAGKTTFISALCRRLNVIDEVSSPTFSIVNEYWNTDSEPVVYHFDFYRIESDAELLDMGLYDYFDSGILCVMEWPEMAVNHLPDDTLHVNLLLNEDGSRTLSF